MKCRIALQKEWNMSSSHKNIYRVYKEEKKKF